MRRLSGPYNTAMQDASRGSTERPAKQPLAGWGRHPVLDCRLMPLHTAEDAQRHLAGAGTTIARGNGRAYGDAALNETLTLSTLGMDRMQRFDAATGLLSCEAGVLLADIIATFLPRGWFPPVVPGTRFVTVGGMIAADVHGKNHHCDSSFGSHVHSLVLLAGDGEVRRCSRTENAALFHATQGGMGLTGIILSATFRLTRIETAFLETETTATQDLAEAMSLFEAEQAAGKNAWPYSVAWLDCLGSGSRRGRCVLSRGRFAAAAALPSRSAPLETATARALRPPWEVLAPFLRQGPMRQFNHLHYALAARQRRSRPKRPALARLEPFFFPLDRLRSWNLAYGARGFVQHQSVLPQAASAAGIAALLREMERAGLRALLAVLKLFGAGSDAPLSFPMPGFTLALDFPMRPETPALLDALDAVVHDHGGRVYLAKDAHLAPHRLRQGYPRLDDFRAARAEVGSDGKFASALSRRLGL